MNRIAKWDNAKFVLIILVVICHFYENYLGSSKLVNSLFFSVYTFHMPAFFLISGIFSKKTVKERKIVKVVPYLLVYLFMKMFGYFVSGIMNGGTFISVDFFREPGAAWFILALFFMYLITFYTKQFRPAYVLIVSVFVPIPRRRFDEGGVHVVLVEAHFHLDRGGLFGEAAAAQVVKEGQDAHGQA